MDRPSSGFGRFVPSNWLVGRSVHQAAEVEAHESADYFVFGTMFPTRSKDAGAPTQRLEVLADAARRSTAPVWAIGGITPRTAAACVSAGARGVAAIGAFLDGGADVSAVHARVDAMRRAVAGHFGKRVQ